MPTTDPERQKTAYGFLSDSGLPTVTAKDTAIVDGVASGEEFGVIENTRTRIEEVENILRDLGFIV